MQALSQQTTCTSGSQALPATQIMPIPAPPAIIVREADHFRPRMQLLDCVTETRRFAALMSARDNVGNNGSSTLGNDNTSDAANSNSNRTSGNRNRNGRSSSLATYPNRPSAHSSKRLDAASYSRLELSLLEQSLFAIALKPVPEQVHVPAILLEYLKHCDQQAAKELLTTPALQELPASRNDNGDTVLHIAIQQNLPTVVKRLLKFSADPARVVNARSGKGLTALFIATVNGYVAIMRTLLALPAIVAQAAIVPKGGWNPLMAAAMDGPLEVGRLLLATATGAEQALAVDCHGRNALMFAALHGRLDFAGLLLAQPSAHAQARALDNGGANALMMAVEAGHASLLMLFLMDPATAGQVIEVGNNGEDALIIAARNGHRKVVDMLLAEPMSEILLDGATCTGSTALMLAAQGGHALVVAMLLSAMTAEQANSVDTDGRNALMLAAEHDRAAVVSLLLAVPKTTRQVLAKDGRGLNALTIATVAGSCATVETLLSSPWALAQVVAIDDRTFNTMAADAFKEDFEKLLALAGAPEADANIGPLTTKARYKLQELTSECPPRVVMKLLPIIARKQSEKRGL